MKNMQELYTIYTFYTAKKISDESTI